MTDPLDVLAVMAHPDDADYLAAGTLARAKAELARAAGAHAVIRYTEQDFESEIRRLTGGDGLDVVGRNIVARVQPGARAGAACQCEAGAR